MKTLVFLVATSLVLASSSFAKPFSQPELELLTDARTRIISFLTDLQSDSTQLASCFAGQICPFDKAQQLDQFRATILRENRRYRKLVGLSRFRSVKRRKSVSPFSTETPSIRLDENEAREVLQLAESDENAMRALIDVEDNTGLPTMSDLRSEALQLYRSQIEQELNRFPYLIYLDSAQPTDAQISAAILKVYSAAEKSKARLSQLKNLSHLLVYQPFLAAVVREKPWLANAYTDLLALPTPGVFGLSQEAESAIMYTYFGCIYLFTIAPAWPIGLSCAAMTIIPTTGRWVENWRRYQNSRTDWLAGLQTYQSLRHKRNQVVVSTVLLAISGYYWIPTIGTIHGPLSEALTQTASTVAKSVVSLQAHKDTIIGLAFGTVQFRGALAVGSGLFKDHSDISSDDELVQVDIGPGLKRVLIEKKPVLTFADYLRLRQEIPQLLGARSLLKN